MAKKRRKPMDKAKESGKKAIEGGKGFGKGARNTLEDTALAIWFALLSVGSKGDELISNKRKKREGITENQRKEHERKAKEHSEEAKAYIKKAGEEGKKIIPEAWGAIKGGGKAVGYAIKGGVHLIDAGDKAIGEQIEKKQIEKGKSQGKILKLFRDNIMKLVFLLSLTGIGGYKAKDISKDKKQDNIEVTIPKEKEQQIKNFFKSPDVLKDLKSSGKDWQDKRENRYLGEDEAWNNMRNGFGIAERKKVIEGMCGMIESGDLEMVIKKADEAGVPRQCVFLALAESGWQAGADSGVAGGYRQFTEKSARLFGLIDDKGNDFRADPEKSTDAAMKHLQENYKIVCNYAKQLGYKLSESDKWIFAFHMYNGSPRLVRRGMIACKGDANKYSEKLVAKTTENNNYVPRILGIQVALYKIFKENGYDVNKVKAACLNQRVVKKTEADSMYEEFIKMEKSLALEEKLERLNEVKEKYEEEYKAGIISKNYYEGAIRVISEAIVSENEEEEEDDEE